MKFKNSIASFLSFTFTENKVDDASVISEDAVSSDSGVTAVNPSTGLPMTSENSLVDVGGNIYGCSENVGSTPSTIIDDPITGNTEDNTFTGGFCDGSSSFMSDDFTSCFDDSSDW